MSQAGPDSPDDVESAMDVVSMSKSQRSPSALPTNATTLSQLRKSYPVPCLNQMWNDAHADFTIEQLKSAMNELAGLQRYARARAVKLHQHLVDVANSTNTPLQLEKGYDEWMDALRNTELIFVNEEMLSAETLNQRLIEEANNKRKRDEKRRRDKDRKKKKKRRSGIQDDSKDAVAKPPDSLWTSTADYFRFPTAEDLELISPNIDESLCSIPALGKHFPDEWKAIDEAKAPSKKKKKSYQAIVRRFRPKSDIMAVADTNVRKQIIDFDKHLKSQKGLQQLALSRRCIAAIFPLRKQASHIGYGTPVSAATPFRYLAPDADPLVPAPDPATPFSGAPFALAGKDPTPGTPKSVPAIKSFFEERVRSEFKSLGLLPASKAKCVDLGKPENRLDDEVTTHLRMLQKQLRTVNAANIARCGAAYPRASRLASCAEVYDILRAAENNLEQVYKTMNSSSWDVDAATTAIEAYDKAAGEWKKYSQEFGNCGTFYVSKPSDFSGTPRKPKNKSTPKIIST
uniref:Uncharacterized protein n=1 Tax=Spongospora subterranea TaxID=70186 RepID=A0A0H5R6V3_9EUKA|eukprot:CRZ09855.1 hypothetical protein [Spongospora subterranea]